MAWLGTRRGHAADWIAQRCVQATARRTSLPDAPWLSGPTGDAPGFDASAIDPAIDDEGSSARGLRPLLLPPPRHHTPVVRGV